MRDVFNALDKVNMILSTQNDIFDTQYSVIKQCMSLGGVGGGGAQAWVANHHDQGTGSACCTEKQGVGPS